MDVRKKRLLQEGAYYHVGARANRKDFILASPGTKELLSSVINQAAGKYDFTIDNFTIMENHFHLIIKPLGQENLSRIMQWILGVFAIRYNKIHGLSGHVWGDRFFSKIIQSAEELLRIFCYIDNNPVKAGLVTSACDWIFGGLHHALNGIQDILGERGPWALQFRQTTESV